MSAKMRKTLDSISQTMGYGNASSSTINLLRGTNHRGGGNTVPANTDNQGITFFTKPNMNLSYDNVRAVRRLAFLADGNDRSMGTAIRCMLSPQIENHEEIKGWRLSSTGAGDTGIRTPLVDDKLAFIPLLTNTLLTMSGWPDMVADSYISDEGLKREQVGWMDSFADNYSSFDLTANFQNLDGDPITALFTAWLEYGMRVAEGQINPYPQSIIENEIDYQTRIYRLVLDPTRTWVRKIADCGAAYPTAVSNGTAFNVNTESFMTEDSDEISIRWQCFGFRYNDPITIYNFNRTVQTFNSQMRDSQREQTMVKLTPQLKRIFNYQGYPRISPEYELEWWVTKEAYAALVDANGNPRTDDAPALF